jgi:hypothetical protein
VTIDLQRGLVTRWRSNTMTGRGEFGMRPVITVFAPLGPQVI